MTIDPKWVPEDFRAWYELICQDLDKISADSSRFYLMIKILVQHIDTLTADLSAREDILQETKREKAEAEKQRDELKAKLSILLPEGPSEMTAEEVRDAAMMQSYKGLGYSLPLLRQVLESNPEHTGRNYMAERYAVQTTETLIATQCALNRVLNELAALQRANQELRSAAIASLRVTDCEGECTSDETCAHNKLRDLLEPERAEKEPEK